MDNSTMIHRDALKDSTNENYLYSFRLCAQI